jgi:hypothetical protein
MSQIKLGQYVTYKQNIYLVVDIRYEKLLIMNKDNKVQVNRTSIEVTNLRPAKEIDGYLVTGKGMIISLTSHKEMKWDNNHGIRKALLAKYANSNSDTFKALMTG